MTKIQFDRLENDGYVIVANYLIPQDMMQLEEELREFGAFTYETANNNNNLLAQSHGTRMLADAIVSGLPAHDLQCRLRPLKAFILDKSTARNWHLPWHQDRKIAVKRRVDYEGYSGWTMESGIPHVEPPLVLLEAMLTARIHIDDSGIDNGGMMLLPGSHNKGICPDPEQTVAIRDAVCPAIGRGGLMLYRPLLLHCSPVAASAKTRRVLQIEFVPFALLPDTLEWHT